jgi:hypothetical protein
MQPDATFRNVLSYYLLKKPHYVEAPFVGCPQQLINAHRSTVTVVLEFQKKTPRPNYKILKISFHFHGVWKSVIRHHSGTSKPPSRAR